MKRTRWGMGFLTGLSVALFISVVIMFLTNSIVSWVMPWTCGQQRSV
jgi:hypothetical protein